MTSSVLSGVFSIVGQLDLVDFSERRIRLKNLASQNDLERSRTVAHDSDGCE